MSSTPIDDARALEQVGPHGGAGDAPARRELDLDEFTEARGVVVADGLGVAEGLEERVGLEDLLLDARRGGGGITAAATGRGRGGGCGGLRRSSLSCSIPTRHGFRSRRLVPDPGQVLHDQLGGLGLARPGLARNQNRLVAPATFRRPVFRATASTSSSPTSSSPSGRVAPHRPVRRVRHGVHVRAQLPEPRAAVLLHHVPAVEGREPREGVDGDEDRARVGVDGVRGVAGAEVVEDARLVEVREGGHVLRVL